MLCHLWIESRIFRVQGECLYHCALGAGSILENEILFCSQVASSVDLIDAESTLSLSKIVKTPGLQGTEESLLQTATSYGVRAKVGDTFYVLI